MATGHRGNKKACQVTHDKDPCWRERDFSMTCLDKNNYDRSACQAQFENYKQCKTFWMNVRLSRSRNGITPHLPDEEERILIKKKYKETGEIPSTGFVGY